MTRRPIPIALALALLPLAGSTPADDPEPGRSLAEAPVEQPREVPGGERMNGLYRSGPIYLAGQPGKADLERFAEEGVTVVINLRTPAEMGTVPFDEPAVLESLGVDSVAIPIGAGEFRPRPEAVEQLRSALAAHEGKAVIHCASAIRATGLWAAHLVKDRGVSQSRADDFARVVTGSPAMVEQYLGRESDGS